MNQPSIHHPVKRKSGAEGAAFRSFVVKESKHILRDKRTMLILFGMPVVMMLLFGFAISTDVRDVRTVVVTSSLDHQTQSLVQALDASEYFDILYTVGTPAEAERLMRNQKADMALVFSYDFASRHEGIQLMTDAADPNMAQQYAAYATQILASHVQAIQAPVPTGPNALAASTRAISPPLTKLLYNPQMKSAYNFVPGIMGMLLMLVCAMMTSISIVREKERGTMEVLLVSPVRPLMIIIAKAVPYLLLALGILVTILLMAHYVLAVPLAGSLFWMMVVSLIYILLALALGLFISTLARTQLAALLMSAMMLLLPCLMLSGMMFPIESMPRILQWVTVVMPPRYYISAMRKLMIMGVGVHAVLTELLVLSGMTAAFVALALFKFNKRLDI
jgi:ABC-2 type transport system permease protein